MSNLIPLSNFEHSTFMQAVGDLNAHVRIQLLHVVAGDDELLFESINLNLTNLMNHLASEIEGRFPPTIQRLLLDRVLLCWLDINHCQAQYGQLRQLRGVQEFWRKQLDRAQQRYIQAIGALAQHPKTNTEEDEQPVF